MGFFLTEIILFFSLFCCAFTANHPQCGTKGPKSQSGRIIGGQNASPGEWPWMGSLQHYRFDTKTFNHSCGCALLNERWALTAAHCVYVRSGQWSGKLRVVFGTINLNLMSKTVQTSEVKKIIYHPLFYRPVRLNNDIAVLKLATPINLTKPDVGTICLPPHGEANDEIVKHSPCVSTGWGLTNVSHRFHPDILQKVNVVIHKQSACKSLLKGLANITDGMVCIGEQDKGVCGGDSGGPLNCKVKDKWFTYGATSFGKLGCHETKVPSVYARASHYAKWIWETIDKNNNQTVV